MLSEIEARQKKRKDEGSPSTPLYQEISTMREFKMNPLAWSKLSRIDKKTLHYHRVMESHYMEQVNEKHERDRKRAEKKQEFMNNLPQQQMRGR